MRKSFYSCLFLMSLLLTGTALWSCSDDDDNGKEGPGEPDYTVNVEVDDTQTASTSAVLVLQTKGISEYAYQVKEGDVSTLPDGEELFLAAKGEGNVVECKSETEKLSILGLEGNKKYTVLVSLKHEKTDKTVEYIVKSASVTTANYDKLLTVLSTTMFGLKFHVECPADKYFKYAVADKLTYESRNMQFEYTGMDMTYLEYGAPIAKGPQTIEWEKVPIYADAPDEGTYQIYPGTAYYILIAECDKDGNMNFESEGGGGDDGPILGSAIDTRTSSLPGLVGDCMDKPIDQGVTFHGFFARQEVRSEAPQKGNGEVKVKIATQTEHTLAFDCTLTGDVKEYLVSMLDETEYETVKRWVGKDGLQAAILTGIVPVIAQETEASSFSIPGLEKKAKYHLFITGICDEEGAVQTYTEMEVSTIESTKPLPVIEITPIEAPEGFEAGAPYNVWFNVKAVNHDCVAMKYLLNSVAEWTSTLNGETSIDDLFKYYGQPLDEETLKSINSDAGANMSFSSWEGTESILKVAAYNEDEAYGISEGRNRTPEEPDKTRIESDLFNTLPSDYTARLTVDNQPKDIKMTVTTNPFCDSPSNYAAFKNNENYAGLLAYFIELERESGSATPEVTGEARLKESFEDYKEMEAKYVSKYRGQNRIVITGFDVLDERSTYMSPWALFCTLNGYNSYGVSDLFYDYGPKMFIEVTNDNVVVPTNTMFIPPVMDWSDAAYYLAAKPVGGSQCGFADFPLNISEDGNTLEIGSITGTDGETIFNPALAQFYGATAYSIFSNDTPIVMKRGWTGATEKALKAAVTRTGKSVGNRKGNHYKTTYLPGFSIKRKHIEATYIPLNEWMKKQTKK